jgi:hypothetical protein
VLKLRQLAVQFPQLKFDVSSAIATISSAAALAHRSLQQPHPHSSQHQGDRHAQLLQSQFPHSPTPSEVESAFIGSGTQISSGSSGAVMSHSHSTISMASQNTTSTSTASTTSSHSNSEAMDQFAPIATFQPSAGGVTTTTTTYSQDGSTPLQTPASGTASGFAALPLVQSSPGTVAFSPPISQSGLGSNVSSNSSNTHVHLSPLQATEQSQKSSTFDGLSVLKATASFATETDTRKLLKRLMACIIETAGATRGCFLQQDEKKNWAIELGASVEVEDLAETETGATGGAAATISTKSSGKNSGESSACASPPTPMRPIALSPIAFTPEITDSLLHLPAANSTPIAPDATRTISAGSSSTSSGSKSLANSGAKLKMGYTSLRQAIPSSVFQYVLSSVETVVLSAPTDLGPYSAFGQDPYFKDPSHRPQAILCMPVLKAGEVYGVVRLARESRSSRQL